MLLIKREMLLRHACIIMNDSRAHKTINSSSSSHLCVLSFRFIIAHLFCCVSDMDDNKHKVAFYFVLVILLVTLRHCHGSKDAAEVISHSPRALPKNTIEITSLGALRRSYADKSVSEKLVEIRDLLRSLLFDWSLEGESSTAGKYNNCS
jgi:hypothetical protein